MLSLPHPLHCPRAQLLKTEQNPPKALDFPKAVFSKLPRADNMHIFMLLPSLLPAARALYGFGSALCPSWPGHLLCAKGRHSSAAGPAPCSSWAALPGHAAGPATLPCPRATLLSRINWNNKFAPLALVLWSTVLSLCQHGMLLLISLTLRHNTVSPFPLE